MNELLYNLSEGGQMNRSLAVKTRDLSKHYDGLKAVDNLNLEIQEGISYGLVGPNEAGKTTTIKMLTGSIEPTSGTTADGCLPIAPFHFRGLRSFRLSTE
ncbi:hypothetical protein AKJ36_02070 [candidate division MSBL1 archaeon SCGC-AAA259I07]|uniref:ABC transporter domain-containing protein n=1 Tax=candidate division MSBL1 archaeon SCGC-AAA259I07 TaxID=1698266 RepID=A0A133UL59_9EURY|nr:hypothetical protein AKJ36_02070 [candidate division MSBL1 archaeon SCGC-AAA259I07]